MTSHMDAGLRWVEHLRNGIRFDIGEVLVVCGVFGERGEGSFDRVFGCVCWNAVELVGKVARPTGLV